MQQSVHIQGIDYILPEQPPDHEIDGYGLEQHAQKFRCIEIPKSFDDVPFSASGDPIYDSLQAAFIDSFIDKIDNGYWFYSNGVITYITGLHFFYLNCWTLEGGFDRPTYRDADRRWFYFFEYCESKPYILGVTRVKQRRIGATLQAACYLVYTCLRKKKSFCGIVSKTGDDARDAFRDMVMHGIRNLPLFIKPWVDDEEAKTEVNFVRKVTAAEKKDVSKIRQMAYRYRGMESKINYKNTTLNSYDSGRKTAVLLDEGGKFEEIPIHVYLSILKRTMMQGAVRVGFVLMPTTVNSKNKGGANYRAVWDGSDQTREKVTRTGLYRYYTPADDGYFGFIDEYGMSMTGPLTKEQKAKIIDLYTGEDWEGDTCADFIRHKRAKIKTDTQQGIEMLQEEVRMESLNINEAFNFGDVDSFLNVENIREQKEWLLNNPQTFRQVEFFEKETTKEDGSIEKVVDFKDDKNGSWKILRLPKPDEINKFELRTDRFRKAGNTQSYTLPVDPFRNPGEAKFGSQGAAWIISKPDSTDKDNTNMPIAMYLKRSKWKEDFHNQIFLAARYYGCLANYESDIKDFWEYAHKNQLMGYIRRRPKNTISPDKKKTDKIEYGTPSNDPFSFGKQLELLKIYFDLHYKKVLFMELLEDAENFDPMDRTKSDLTVSFGIGLTDCVPDTKPKTAESPMRRSIIKTYDLSKKMTG